MPDATADAVAPRFRRAESPTSGTDATAQVAAPRFRAAEPTSSGAGDAGRPTQDGSILAPRRRPVDIRRTPCIGICSTTYGDLVCRGCKRFAHEIVGWNRYHDSQRERVWARLHTLLGQSVRAVLAVVDDDRLLAAAQEARIAGAATLPLEVLAFQTMQALPLPLAALGLAAHEDELDTREAVRFVDREFHARSCAHYEMSFKTLA